MGERMIRKSIQSEPLRFAAVQSAAWAPIATRALVKVSDAEGFSISKLS